MSEPGYEAQQKAPSHEDEAELDKPEEPLEEEPEDDEPPPPPPTSCGVRITVGYRYEELLRRIV